MFRCDQRRNGRPARWSLWQQTKLDASRFRCGGGHTIIDSQDVDDGYAIWLHEAKPGTSPPRHIHHREDEIFYLLQGRLLLWCDGKIADAGPGDTIVLPKGLAHTWLVTGTTPAKLLAFVVPGGLARFFDRMAGTGTGHDVLPED